MKQNFKLIYTCGNTFRRGVTEPAISDHNRFNSVYIYTVELKNTSINLK